MTNIHDSIRNLSTLSPYSQIKLSLIVKSFFTKNDSIRIHLQKLVVFKFLIVEKLQNRYYYLCYVHTSTQIQITLKAFFQLFKLVISCRVSGSKLNIEYSYLLFS